MTILTEKSFCTFKTNFHLREKQFLATDDKNIHACISLLAPGGWQMKRDGYSFKALVRKVILCIRLCLGKASCKNHTNNTTLEREAAFEILLSI